MKLPRRKVKIAATDSRTQALLDNRPKRTPKPGPSLAELRRIYAAAVAWFKADSFSNKEWNALVKLGYLVRAAEKRKER